MISFYVFAFSSFPVYVYENNDKCQRGKRKGNPNRMLSFLSFLQMHLWNIDGIMQLFCLRFYIFVSCHLFFSFFFSQEFRPKNKSSTNLIAPEVSLNLQNTIGPPTELSKYANQPNMNHSTLLTLSLARNNSRSDSASHRIESRKD